MEREFYKGHQRAVGGRPQWTSPRPLIRCCPGLDPHFQIVRCGAIKFRPFVFPSTPPAVLASTHSRALLEKQRPIPAAVNKESQ